MVVATGLSSKVYNRPDEQDVVQILNVQKCDDKTYSEM